MEIYKKLIDNIKKNKKYTFMIIPNTTDKIIRFTFSYRSLITVASSSIIALICLITFSSSFFYVNQSLSITKRNLSVLQNENSIQQERINTLVKKSEEVHSKLENLVQLESQVMDLVGLEGDLIMESDQFIVSRSDFRTFVLDENYEDSIDILHELVEEQTTHMKQLIKDVEKQLAHLESIPDLRPANGRITSGFGFRISPINRRREFHNGIDIANKTNTDIYASASGIVTFSGYNGSYGRMIMISHGNGYTTVYAHNSKNLVNVGDKVSKGDVIAKLGSTGRSTGPHVHFEIRKNGKPINPNTMLVN